MRSTWRQALAESAVSRCCFCGEGMEPTLIDPVTIDLTANDEEISQLLWAHARCLVAARISDLRDEFYEED
jgi:hypothetical protein